MAGTCLIPVDASYVNSLLLIVEECHADTYDKWLKSLVTGVGGSNDVSLEALKTLSDIIFFLTVWDDNIDDCSLVHCAKDVAMRICKSFTETDITGSEITQALLTEQGSAFLTEDNTRFLQTE